MAAYVDVVVLVVVEDIVWIKANRNTVRIHAGGRVHELREPARAVRAPGPTRVRPRAPLGRRRRRRVRSIQPWFNGYQAVTMNDGQRLRMSRYQHESFLRLATARGDE